MTRDLLLVAARAGQTTPIYPHHEGILVCNFIWGYAV